MRPLRPGCEPPSAGDRATHPRAAPSPPPAHRSFRTVPADYSFQAASPQAGYASRNGEGELRQFRFEFGLLVHDPDAALLAERRICEHHREAFRPGSLAKLSTPDRIGDSSGAIPCRQRFMMQSRAVAGTDLPALYEALPQVGLPGPTWPTGPRRCRPSRPHASTSSPRARSAPRSAA